MRVDIRTTDDQFHSVHTALDKVRSTSKSVRVDKQALINLLLDYSELISLAEEDNCVVIRDLREVNYD